LLTVGASFGQEKEPAENKKVCNNKTTYGLFGFAGNTFGGGFEMETFYRQKEDKNTTSVILNASYGKLEITQFGITADATISEVALGSRTYVNKNNDTKGFFCSNYLTYGKAEFKEFFYSGKYRYFSFFKPELGYRFQFGKFNLNIFANTMWKIELKGKGAIENRYHDNWKTKGGLTVGYSF